MRRVLAVLCILLFPSLCAAAPLGYGAISLGATRAMAERKQPGLDCREFPECEYNDMVGGRLVLVKLRFEKGRAAQINLVFTSDDFRQIKAALVRRRGAPATVRKVGLPDPAGGHREYQQLVWTFKDGTITADEYAFVVDGQRLGVVCILARGFAPMPLLQEPGSP